jgi:hypothetical protein
MGKETCNIVSNGLVVTLEASKGYEFYDLLNQSKLGPPQVRFANKVLKDLEAIVLSEPTAEEIAAGLTETKIAAMLDGVEIASSTALVMYNYVKAIVDLTPAYRAATALGSLITRSVVDSGSSDSDAVNPAIAKMLAQKAAALVALKASQVAAAAAVKAAEDAVVAEAAAALKGKGRK